MSLTAGSKSKIVILLVLMIQSCIDKLEYDILKRDMGGVVVDGFISDETGPYTVRLKETIPIGDLEKLYRPISGAAMSLLDSRGNKELLIEHQPGIYSSTSIIKGEVGNAYWIEFTLKDGRAFRSLPDTIVASPDLKKIDKQYIERADISGSRQPEFDIFATAKPEAGKSKNLIWFFTGTYKINTDPSCINIERTGCNFYEAIGKCNFLPLCSGLVNVGGVALNPPVNPPRFERRSPCQCCTCWYSINNTNILLSNPAFFNADKVLIYSVPVDRFIFFSKLHVRVEQRGLSNQAHAFWKLVASQKKGVKDIFQPVAGKIPSYFVQLAGNPTSVLGMFSAVSIHQKSFEIKKEDIPNFDVLPPIPRDALCASCLSIFPQATNIRPSFWID
ncbi:MAG: DUF4249 family protein [Flammeovirgaceae bacterium]